ncbi:hypothetical protein [Xenococcus sp. PCC 7305]
MVDEFTVIEGGFINKPTYSIGIAIDEDFSGIGFSRRIETCDRCFC